VPSRIGAQDAGSVVASPRGAERGLEVSRGAGGRAFAGNGCGAPVVPVSRSVESCAKGMDSLLSIVQNARGDSSGNARHRRRGATNAALLAVAILANSVLSCVSGFVKFRERKRSACWAIASHETDFPARRSCPRRGHWAYVCHTARRMGYRVLPIRLTTIAYGASFDVESPRHTKRNLDQVQKRASPQGAVRVLTFRTLSGGNPFFFWPVGRGDGAFEKSFCAAAPRAFEGPRAGAGRRGCGRGCVARGPAKKRALRWWGG